MTTLAQLQQHLKNTGRYCGAIDGQWGRLTEAGILLMITDGQDTTLTDADFADSANRLGVTPAHIKAVCAVEANGAGFFAGRPLILPEPHRFAKATGQRFNASHPTVSYKAWGTRPYPKTQDARYDLLLKMIKLDVDAGFGAASYGKFQIMGENHKLCGYATTWQFAEAMARDEKTQLRAFEEFIKNTGLLDELRRGDWAGFARGYNGSGYAKNKYDVKLAQAFKRFGG
jgi:hypothetical protein